MEKAMLYLTGPSLAVVGRQTRELVQEHGSRPQSVLSVDRALAAAPQTRSAPYFRFPPKRDISTMRRLTRLLGPWPRVFRRRSHTHRVDSCRSGPKWYSAHLEGATATRAPPSCRSGPFRLYPF